MKRGPGRPPIAEEDRKIPVKIRLHPKQAKKLARNARVKKLSMGKFVGQLIDEQPEK